jgi:hypothetical protein
MKDLPHHMKKLNRQIVRSVHHEKMADANFENKLPSPPNWKPTEAQIKKQAKEKVIKERQNRKPIHKTEEERNWEMKHRTPIFDRTSHPRPKETKASHKKRPKI